MGFGYLAYFYAFAFAVMTVVGLPQPFSLPPLPEDPALLRIAPADSIGVYAWNGTAAVDPRSSNQTEQLAAEPEVRASIEALRRATAAMVGSNLQGAGGIARATLDLVCAALQRPGCVFLRDAANAPKRRLDAGLALHLGDEIKKGRALLDLLSLALRATIHGEKHDDIEVDDVRFRALPTDIEHEFLGWAEVDGWLLLAIGERTPAAMLHGLQGTDQGLRGNTDCNRLLQTTAVARPATRTFVAVQRLTLMLQAFGGEQAGAIASALGLAKATHAFATSGLDGDGFRWRIELETPTPEGLLGAFAGDPVSQDALLPVPADADLAIAARVDPMRLEQALVDCVHAIFGGDAESAYASFQREFADHLGADWRRDLVQHLDGQLTAWNAPSQGGLGVTAATGAIGLRDGATFGAAWNKVVAKMQEQMPARSALGDSERNEQYRSFLESFPVRDHTVQWIDAGRGAPIAMTFAATPGAFVLGALPAPVRATLDALDGPNPDRSLVRWPNVNKRGSATAMLHFDARTLLTSTWPLLMLQFQEASSEWQLEAFAFGAADLPRLDALTAHLGRELTTLEPHTGGYRLARTGTLPVFDPLSIAAALAIGAALAN